MKNIYKVSILFTIIVLCSCQKLLNEETKSFLTSDSFPANQAEAVTAMNGAYNVLQEVNLFSYNMVNYMSTGDDLVHPQVSPPTGFPGFSMSFQISASDAIWTTFWTYLWKGVNNTNGVIAALNKLNTPANAAWVNADLAEMRSLRAFYYFYLVRMYGDLPIRLEPTTEIVLVAPRVSADSIYKVIINDLSFADNKLPNMANGGGRFTAGAVKGLMAQVYMTMAGWRRTSQGKMVKGDANYYVLARNKALEIINSNTYTLNADYSQIFKNLSTNVADPEIIWDVPFEYPDKGSQFPYFFGAFSSGGAATSGGGNCQARTNSEFANTLDLNDTRVAWNIANYSYGSGNWTKTAIAPASSNTYGLSKYQKINPALGQFFNNFSTNFPLIRYDDILLIYAEADNEINNGPSVPNTSLPVSLFPSQTSYDVINLIRYRARPATNKLNNVTGQPVVLPNYAAGSLTHDTFLAAIQKERAIELILENTRRFDLERWGVLVQKVQAATSQVAAANVADRHYLFPVPPADIVANNWTQNEGY
jgi:hypothetical protein